MKFRINSIFSFVHRLIVAPSILVPAATPLSLSLSQGMSSATFRLNEYFVNVYLVHTLDNSNHIHRVHRVAFLGPKNSR